MAIKKKLKATEQLANAIGFAGKEVVRVLACYFFVYAFYRTLWHVTWPYSVNPHESTDPNDPLKVFFTAVLWYGASLMFRLD